MANVVLTNIAKRFGDVIAVDDVNLEIADREFVVVSRRPHRDRDALFLACTGRSIPESNLQWLLDGDDIVCWGANANGQLGLGTAEARVPRPTRVKRQGW